MPKPYPRKERLEKLVDLARMYREWSDKKLALELGRNVHNIIPDSGIPKLDLVMRLAEALDWPVEVVVADLCEASDSPAPALSPSSESDPTRLLREAHALVQEGRYEDATRVVDDALASPVSSELRVHGLTIQSIALDGLGHYTRSIDTIQRALRETNGLGPLAPWLRGNLASAYYMLGQLAEAEALATVVVCDLGTSLSESDGRQTALAIALFVRGNCRRVRAGVASDERMEFAARSLDDLRRAAAIFDDYLIHNGSPRDLAPARTCRGGILEMQVLLGQVEAEAATMQFLASLGDPCPHGVDPAAWLESSAWWSIFGANVVMRHVADEDRLQQLMAIFTTKADEVAQRLGHWALREHVWALEHTRRRMRELGTIDDQEWVLDREDVRTVAGAMGRFPLFRETGWQILRSVRLVED